jgi:hypothetical protein
MLIFKKFPRHRNLSRSDPREKYIIEPETREITATVVSHRNVADAPRRRSPTRAS